MQDMQPNTRKEHVPEELTDPVSDMGVKIFLKLKKTGFSLTAETPACLLSGGP
ncbi:MAG: hypothetical protein ACPLUI_01305 [Desulfofundulus sp.]